jgi:hypothetical protein
MEQVASNTFRVPVEGQKKISPPELNKTTQARQISKLKSAKHLLMHSSKILAALTGKPAACRTSPESLLIALKV